MSRRAVVRPCSSARRASRRAPPLPSASSTPLAASATMLTTMKSAMRARRRVAELAGVAGRPHVLHRVAVRRVLRIGRPDRVLLVGVERLARRSRSHACSHGSNCSFSIMKRRNSLAAFGYFVYLHDHLVEEQVRLGRLADRPDREGRVLDVGGHLLDLRVRRVLRGVVDRDAVVGDADLAVEEGLVVVRVEPGQRAGDEGRVELLARTRAP